MLPTDQNLGLKQKTDMQIHASLLVRILWKYIHSISKKLNHNSILKDQTFTLYSNFRENRIWNMVLSPNGIITSDKLCCIYFDSSHFDQNEQQSEGL